MEQYLFYQHNVQQFFLRHLPKYQGIAVPLSIAKSFADGTSGFLRALCAKDATKHFLIDPRTALLQRGWNRQHVRDPHKRMAEVFGSPFDVGLTRELQPADFSREILQSVTQRCIAYQLTFRSHEPEQKRKLDKYAKLAGLQSLPAMTNPQLLVPPYLLFSNTNDVWFSHNAECVAAACAANDPANVRPIFHFEQFSGVGDLGRITELLDVYNLSSVFLYADDFREHDKSHNELTAYKTCVATMVDADIQPYVLHGGYFAIALSKIGLAGFGNGVGYSEWRSSSYHKGGTAERRIYIPKLHRFLEPAKAQDLIGRAPGYFTEDSALLAACAAFDRPLADISLEEALDHFMECRAAEMAFVAAHNPAEIAAKLRETVALLDTQQIQFEYGGSLARWAAVISTF